MSETWTLETLHTHWTAMRAADKEAVSTALAAAEKAVNAALIASEKAILKAENAGDKRAEASNEIRAAMIDQQKNFANKEQTDLRLKYLEDTVRGNQGIGLGATHTWQVIAMVVAAVVSILGIVFVIQGATR